MENSLTNLPPTTPPRYGAYSSSLNSSRENRTKENNRNGQDMDKDTKKGRKMSVLALLGKLSKSRDTNRSQSPFSPPPYSSSSTPPWHDSTTAPRLSNQLSPPTSTSLVSIHLKPAESSTPVTQFNIATLQAELDGRLGPMGGRGCVGVRDVSKPNPLGPDGGDDYDELLELGRSVRGTSRLEEEQERSRKKLVSGVERWLDGVEDGVPAEG
ncbi:uncharacterized protein BDCG_08507 [Blastomyces dermatitidis ER-3]|uniref:Uncharacterized protein n=1 Tax=Ajellomyces dermatitidis (strain ER-3 / ATCC MYA-2586) TaxID=559297 RepID=A0ABP2EQA0_AJEDR|nr:uncharacterized protein BDCG_08507 [Blastomyces dermatitidis ER-3]EEQ85238.2 hypothetical protein BDCG_08507 [Blastomyces dermatitidis ER-3]